MAEIVPSSEIASILQYLLDAVAGLKDRVSELESVPFLLDDHDRNIDSIQEHIYELSAQIVELRNQINQLRASIMADNDWSGLI